eukprot:SAG11_NODE_5161_length_1643_cov_1.185233_4_plen_119_part_00
MVHQPAVLTGECEILSQDIVYDSGMSLNPLLGIGQVEGCFMMAAGMCDAVCHLRCANDLRLNNQPGVSVCFACFVHTRLTDRCMTEQQVRSSQDGRLINNGTSTYVQRLLAAADGAGI